MWVKMILLEGVGVTKHFGSLAAVRNVSFSIKEGEIVGLIGPNGAGKTTLFNLISGTYRPTAGMIKFKGQNITSLQPYKNCNLGIGKTHQIPLPFLNMTTTENVMVGALFGKGKLRSLKNARTEALHFIEFVGLLDKKDVPATSLTLFDRKVLEVARVLATHPEIILLDEVVAGLNPAETSQAIKLIKRILDELGITVFWVEHIMKAVMSIAERIIVLHHGEKIAEGEPQEIASNDEVIKAYLGRKYIF